MSLSSWQRGCHTSHGLRIVCPCRSALHVGALQSKPSGHNTADDQQHTCLCRTACIAVSLQRKISWTLGGATLSGASSSAEHFAGLPVFSTCWYLPRRPAVVEDARPEVSTSQCASPCSSTGSAPCLTRAQTSLSAVQACETCWSDRRRVGRNNPGPIFGSQCGRMHVRHGSDQQPAR